MLRFTTLKPCQPVLGNLRRIKKRVDGLCHIHSHHPSLSSGHRLKEWLRNCYGRDTGIVIKELWTKQAAQICMCAALGTMLITNISVC